MGKVTLMVSLIFGISFGLYVIGYESAFLQMLSNVGSTPEAGGSVINNILLAFSVAITGSIVTGLISGGSSLARSSALILFFGLFMLNFIFLPITFLFDGTLPVLLRMFIAGLLNLMAILTALDLLTERDL